ncbi:MAG: acyl-protein synthetase [Herbinix sp.]|jgi:phenylacetate-coenzyme A ligase PaaK-like adenylate-forming protein|nr:acyl-protein synthetase [Herbinix sp.]
MDYRKRLFTHRKLYDHTGTETLFVKAAKCNVAFHRKHCSEYAVILADRRFRFKQMKTIDDLYKIPVLPTLYFKSHRIHSIPEKKMLIKATSSGTKGKKSHIGFDAKGLFYGAFMVLRTASFHKLFSLKPVNYILLGYKPDKNNHTVISKTAFGATFFAPAIRRTYALKPSPEGYQLDLLGLKKALLRYSRQPVPVRLIGFPSYLYFFLTELKKAGLQLHLPKSSMVLLGGGWKQFYTEKVEKDVLYALIEEVLGIKEYNVKEFFGAVEHPIIYCDCKNHHFHVPVYSRVIIRDVNTLLPVENGKVGLVNFLTPMVESMPLTSVMTDDLGILHDGKECGCGLTAPYFEILGRVGVTDIKTCAAGAAELLGGAQS